MRVTATLLIIACAVGIPILLAVIQKNQDAAKRSTCTGHLSFLSHAMHNYHESHGHLPPAFVLGPDGKPWHSWRVLILPYFEHNDLYKEYKFDEPWNGPNNSKLAARMPNYYACPADPEGQAKGLTNYFVVVGPLTVFPASQPMKFADITRPHDKTILLVEAEGLEINWLEPRDLSFADMSFDIGDPKGQGISSKHRGPGCAMVDGTKRVLDGVKPFDLRTMLLARPEVH